MKVRTDFVTNSSSSSFILARKGELTEKQKQVIIEYVEEKMLGRKMLTPGSSEEAIRKAVEENYIDEDFQEKIKRHWKKEKLFITVRLFLKSAIIIWAICLLTYGKGWKRRTGTALKQSTGH